MKVGKLLAVVVAGLLSLGMAAGCGKKEPEQTPAKKKATTEKKSTKKTPAKKEQSSRTTKAAPIG